MNLRHLCRFNIVGALTASIVLTVVPIGVAQDDRLEFFESKIRPVLIEHCYKCHNSVDRAEGDLAVDWRTAIQTESGQGIAVVPGQPGQSLLLQAIRHERPGLEMPEDGAKLDDEVIANFEKWIADGANDPRDAPPSAEELTAATSWSAILEKRRSWWSLQPVTDPPIPADPSASTSHPVDRFIRAQLKQQDLTHTGRADRRTLIRRLSFVLTGLPPSAELVERFVEKNEPYESVVDELLNAPAFGERWARHWMDLVRYADSHGSEGDPMIPHAYQYRDYLIRAFNSDVPYDQLVREHIAGDLLANPRINRQLSINESAIGPAHWRMVFHGFAPTDALDEKVRFTDDQVNVLGKAFQALTISCARCHDHKFDAISQADYYAVFGILASCRPATKDVNSTEQQNFNRQQLKAKKLELRNALAARWLEDLPEIPNRLQQMSTQMAGDEPDKAEQRRRSLRVSKPWMDVATRIAQGSSFPEAWDSQVQEWNTGRQQLKEDLNHPNAWEWDLGRNRDYQDWFPEGNGLQSNSSPPGEFSIAADGNRIVDNIYPSGAYTHLLSFKHRGFLGSPRFRLDDEYVAWVQLIGGGQSSIRYVVQNYPRSGTVYPINDINRSDWYWHRLDLAYWQGDDVHLELATAQDAPVQVKNNDRSWFGIRRVVVRKKSDPGPRVNQLEWIEPLLDLTARSRPASLAELAQAYQATVRTAVQNWRSGRATDAESLLLTACLQEGLLTNTSDQLPEVKAILETIRQLDRGIPVPTRAPGIAEADAFDQPLFERGNHKKPMQPVPRRFLEVIDRAPFKTNNSGRLELAAAILDPENPLTSRVAVNRIWYYLFGRGIVATPDNFGKLGEAPTHPELLDHLATQLVQNGWSIKKTIRYILLTETWQQASSNDAGNDPRRRGPATGETPAENPDPDNKYYARASVRRLDAESVRDSLLFAAGQLDDTMFGPGVGANSGSRRRSIYIQSRRNSLDRFLQAFDAPIPFATVGRRSSTNVPAQSLTLMNDPFVREMARQAANRKEIQSVTDPLQRASAMIALLLGRPASTTTTADPSQSADGAEPGEAQLLVDFVNQSIHRNQSAQRQRSSLQSRLADSRQALAAIMKPARQNLLAELSLPGNRPEPPTPTARWDFTRSLQDTIGNLNGTPVGKVSRTDEGLVVDSAGYVKTPPISQPVREKTLEVWVQLANLNQRGGGAISIQDLQGNRFDSIVFGEQDAGHWMAGSNFFERTQRFGGSPETEADSRAVHVAIVYEANGTIRGYRDGQPYGKPYRKSAVMAFQPSAAQFVFGLRHGVGISANRMLTGIIREARFYDRALSAPEIALSAGSQLIVGRKEILESLSGEQQKRVRELENQLQDWEARLASLEPPVDENEAWARAAHVLFNLKEFIYIR